VDLNLLLQLVFEQVMGGAFEAIARPNPDDVPVISRTRVALVMGSSQSNCTWGGI
jgi:hypothetical protein